LCLEVLIRNTIQAVMHTPELLGKVIGRLASLLFPRSAFIADTKFSSKLTCFLRKQSLSLLVLLLMFAV
jgi:hypothetical protein